MKHWVETELSWIVYTVTGSGHNSNQWINMQWDIPFKQQTEIGHQNLLLHLILYPPLSFEVN